VLFVDGQQSPVSTGTVGKQWVHVNNRIFLIESIGWPAISNQVAQMPQASNLNPRRGSIRGLALLDSAPKRGNTGAKVSAGSLGSANVPLAPVGVPPMKVVKADKRGRRLVMDWDLLAGSGTLTLQGDTTYLASSLVNITSLLTIEGGAVVKYTTNGQISVSGSGSNIVCETSPVRPAVFSSCYDGSIGVIISNGTPVLTTNTYLSFTVGGT
jgi:hypothetical protein